MNFQDKEIYDMLDAFGIKLNRIVEKPIYENIGDAYYTKDITSYDVNYYSEPVFEVELNKKFIYMLLDYYTSIKKTNTNNYYYNSSYDYVVPNATDFINYVNNRIKCEEKEKELQEKHPELREIIRDYEVTKALIVNDNKKS